MATTKKTTEHASASKAIKAELKTAFPSIKFSVTSDSYTGGSSIRVKWIDGPTEKQVQQYTDKYQQGHFNGMEDIYEYSNSRDDIPQVKFLFTDRKISEDVKQEWFKKSEEYFGDWDTCEEYEKKRRWYDHISKTDLRPVSYVELFEATRKELETGTVTPEQLAKAAEDIYNNKAAVFAELKPYTKKDLLKKFNHGYNRNDYKKEQLIVSCFGDMISGLVPASMVSYSFNFGKGETMTQQALKKVQAATAEQIRNYSAEVLQARKESAERRKAWIESMKNPQTLRDFADFLSVYSIKKLTAEQLERYDALKSEEANSTKTATTAKRIENSTAGADMTITETTHTKTGATIYIAKMSARVDKEQFSTLRSRAKMFDGYYSRYSSGFIFDTEENAKQFAGDTTTENTAENVELTEQEKREAAADRLLELSEAREERASDKMNADRKTNTARRARIAAGIEADAVTEINISRTVKAIATGIINDSFTVLQNVKHMTQIELLLWELRTAHRNAANGDKKHVSTVEDISHCESVESFVVTVDALSDTYRKIENTDGLNLIARKIRKVIKTTKTEKVRLTKATIEWFEKIAGRGDDLLNWQLERVLNRSKSLSKMGIEYNYQMRTALRELFRLDTETAETCPVKKAERELMTHGKKSFREWFPTPEKVAFKMVEYAGIDENSTVLEPSAGRGDICDAIKTTGATIEAIEIDHRFAPILEKKNINVVETGDFLTVEPEEKYSAVIMNPPFSKNQDIEHVLHAFKFLKNGGRLVAVMSEHSFFSNDKESVSFRSFCDEYAEHIEQNETGTFKDSDVSTGVNTRIIVLVKPETEETAAKPEPLTEIVTAAPAKQPEKKNYTRVNICEGLPLLDENEREARETEQLSFL